MAITKLLNVKQVNQQLSKGIPAKLAYARVSLQKPFPYFTSAVWAVQLVESPGLGTFATDEHWRFYYDPEIVHQWDVKEIKAVIIHEISHLLRGHASRCKSNALDPILWNLAADCEINDDLPQNQEIKLPVTACYPKTFKLKDNQLAEQYYKELENKSIKVEVTITNGQCGSSANATKEGYELPVDDDIAPGISKIQQDLIRKQTAQDIINNKDRGNVPAGWRRWAEEILQSKIDWTKEIASFIRNAIASQSGLVDYTYSKRNRRQTITPKIILPGLHQPIPSVAVLVDTSGSMGQKELIHCLAEIKKILSQLGIKNGIQVISCDADVHFSKQIFNKNKVELLGGGGTDMRVGLKKILTIKPKIDVCICLTDGYTPWPDAQPNKFKLVVGLVGNGHSGMHSVPKYAKCVEIKD